MEADVVVIGAGPAGLQAGIHAARKKAVTVVIGRTAGSAAYGVKLENYFGVAGPAAGTALLTTGVQQAESFGCTVVTANVTAAVKAAGRFQITAENGKEYTAKAVVLATGISRIKLGVPGEKEFLGKGVSYCAACDCNFYKGKTVVVYGGQSEAAASAELMTKYAAKVYWVAPAFCGPDYGRESGPCRRRAHCGVGDRNQRREKGHRSSTGGRSGTAGRRYLYRARRPFLGGPGDGPWADA